MTDWKLLAAESRKLADECVNESAPPLIPYELERGGLYCVAGLLGKRVFNDVFALLRCFREAGRLDGVLVLDLLIDANNEASDADRHGAVVFPLLALADAAGEATASEPERA